MKIVSNPRFATVTSLLALVVALGGTSYAAVSLPKDSVGAKQIKSNAVSAKKVKDGSLTTADFSPTELATLKGPQGPQGAKGDTGTVDTSTVYNKAASDARYLRGTITVSAAGSANVGSFGTKIASCPSGFQAMGGGVDPFNILTIQVTSSGPIVNGSRSLNLADGQHAAATGWQASVVNNSAATAAFVVTVVCAPIG